MSITNELINWIKNQPIFWQVALDRLLNKRQLKNEDIIELKEICKSAFQISTSKFEVFEYSQLPILTDNSTKNKSLTISKIHNIHNINALPNTTQLEFSKRGINIIYGDNGSGKSSYVSILKNVCNTRGNKPKLNNNIYTPDSKDIVNKASVDYFIDDSEIKTIKIENNRVDSSILKKIDVFDSLSASHYIEGEDEIAFIPLELRLLDKLAKILQLVEEEIKKELSDQSMKPFEKSLLQLPDTSSAHNFVSNLSSKTTLAELRQESIWNSKKQEIFEKTNLELAKLKTTDPKKQIMENNRKIESFKSLLNKLAALEDRLTGTILAKYLQIINNYIISKEALKHSSSSAFSDLPLEGIGNSSWKILWDSARKFYNQSTNTNDFPNIKNNALCPLCLQELNEEALNRFNNFEQFVKNDIQKSYDIASEKLKTMIDNLRKLDFIFEEYKHISNDLKEFKADYSIIQQEFLTVLENKRNEILDYSKEEQTLKSIVNVNIKNNPRLLIQQAIDSLINSNEMLETKSIDAQLLRISSELNQLMGEKKLFEFRPKLGREICRLKKVELIKKCISKCNTTQLTKFSNTLAEKYVTQKLQDNFKNELNKLGFKNIKIEAETKGKKGKQYHYLRLDEGIKIEISLKDILSEGEHRCISLATFLAELSISDHKSSIIFDDPVCSLDHKWRNKIAKRIVEEGLDRQVIVFTHDITFLLMIQEFSKNLKCEINIQSLTRKTKETGIVNSNPPWDASPVRIRIGKLKNAHQLLGKIERTETTDNYRDQAKLLYGKLRETWERFIEEVFLNGAIQRFSREIQTKRLSKIIDLENEDYKIVEDNMTKCSKYLTGHDSAGELIEDIPTSDEVLQDIITLENYIQTINRRRK